MKNTNKKSISISGFCLIVLTVLIGVGAAHAQTITYKRAIKLPPHFAYHLSLNDSGLGATDLDTQVYVSDATYPSPKSRYVISRRQFWTM
jgi:hypothetical protein